MVDDLPSPGWDAIQQALESIYAGREPIHYGTVVPYALGGPDPLPGISAYRRRDPDHWHLVTYGFTELYEKETEDASTSGFGFELTIRVACESGEEKPPPWALGFLQNLGRYVFETGNRFGIGHHMPLNSPICLGSPTPICAVAFGRDPELGPFTSANGEARFLQVVGITADELALVMDWNAESFLKELAATSPLLLTDILRRSLLDDPASAARLRARADAEGSSMDSSYLEDARLLPGATSVWELGALYVESLRRGLKGRLLHGRSYRMLAQDLSVVLTPERGAAFDIQGNELALRVSPELARAMLATLKPKRGDYAWSELPGFVLRVLPTEIKDQKGGVQEVLG